MKEKHCIYGVHVTDRVKNALSVQQILTDFGQCIRTRLGLHMFEGEVSARGGVILLEMAGDEARWEEMAGLLAAIPGVEVQRMVFDHPDS